MKNNKDVSKCRYHITKMCGCYLIFWFRPCCNFINYHSTYVLKRVSHLRVTKCWIEFEIHKMIFIKLIPPCNYISNAWHCCECCCMKVSKYFCKLIPTQFECKCCKHVIKVAFADKFWVIFSKVFLKIPHIFLTGKVFATCYVISSHLWKFKI